MKKARVWRDRGQNDLAKGIAGLRVFSNLLLHKLTILDSVWLMPQGNGA